MIEQLLLPLTSSLSFITSLASSTSSLSSINNLLTIIVISVAIAIVLISLIAFVIIPFLSQYISAIRPTICTYPWDLPTDETTRANEKRKIVMLAGSFNPPHKGHFAMLGYLAQRYDEVIAVVGMNARKKYDVTPMERARLIKHMLTAEKIEGNVRVEVVSGLIWKHAMKLKVSIMYRGIRSWKQDGRDEMVLLSLNTMGPWLLGPLKRPIPTVYLEGKPEFNHISSTLVRRLCRIDAKKDKKRACETLEGMIPRDVVGDVMMLYGR